MTDTQAEQHDALQRANDALIECLELFKTIRRAELEESDDTCILTLATIGQRIADGASDATMDALQADWRQGARAAAGEIVLGGQHE